MRSFTLGVMQLPVGDLEALARLGDGIREAELIILPEYSNALPDARGAPADEWLEALAGLASEHGAHVIAGVLLEEGSCRYSAVAHVEPDGSWSVVHRKMMLYRAYGADESRLLCPGSQPPPVLDLGFARVGVLACYELRFPELARSLALRGAELIAAPAAWYEGPLKEEHLVLVARARALDNTVWVAVADQPAPRFAGRSLLASPLGVVRVQLGTAPGYIEAVVDEEELQEARRLLPVLRDAAALNARPAGGGGTYATPY